MANKFMTLEGRENWRMKIEVPPRELGGDCVETDLERMIPALLGQVSPILRKTDYVVQSAPEIIRENLDFNGKLAFGGGNGCYWATERDGKIVEMSKAHLTISSKSLTIAKNHQINPELTFFGIMAHEIFEADNLIADGIKTLTPIGAPKYEEDPAEVFASARATQFLGQQFGGQYCVRGGCIYIPNVAFRTEFSSRQTGLDNY